MMPGNQHLGKERRKYIRLDSVFPVHFQALNLDGTCCFSEWLQGFTNNVGKGGLCLVVNNLDSRLAQDLKDMQAKLSLEIQMPLDKKAVPALGKVAWMREISEEPHSYLIGLSYEEIDKAANQRIMRYAWTKKLFFPAALSIIAVLSIGFAVNSYISIKLIKGNKALVEQLVKIVQESSIAKQKVKGMYKERQDLGLKIQELESRIQTLREEKSARGKKSDSQQTQQLTNLIDKLSYQKSSLEEQLASVQHQESSLTEELLRLDKKKVTLEKANMDKMYQWLRVHQNPRTGLVMSFEGDRDVEKWAFSYDQALAMQAYTNFSDFERAKKMLEFFQKKAKRIEGRFLNAYYVNDGSPAEYAVHSGPNIWLGISIVQYTHKTQDKQYLKLAEELAGAIIKLQDDQGGIPGGPNIAWYSTEHNLDAYAFFNMLHQITGKPEYLKARDRVLDWLVRYTYDRGDIPIKRGRGDSTIATDTYAWSIAAIGPEKLQELGLNPDRIMEFAEANCSVKVCYLRPEGQRIEIAGFDFAPERHVARGSVISSEWTAQMILSLRIMADFYYKKGMIAKARAYELKADTYLAELGNMVISSASPSGQGESCMPYATQDYVDTGHGWFTPKGCSTGSVSGTVYTIFAYYRYNPLELSG